MNDRRLIFFCGVGGEVQYSTEVYSFYLCTIWLVVDMQARASTCVSETMNSCSYYAI